MSKTLVLENDWEEDTVKIDWRDEYMKLALEFALLVEDYAALSATVLEEDTDGTI
jgi:hypothetical protein